ncbi:MAG TPA: hypothetical protein VG605_19475 [Puia sp.]|nr:hypothetical protein [Puia sp.]
MKSELYNCIKSLDINKLSEDDKEELLRIFMATKNDLIRDQIAFIFSDLHFVKAIPYIFKRINQKSAIHNNGSLVHSLQEFDLKKYFIPLVKVICEQEYEPRLLAYGLVQQVAPTISSGIRRKALAILEEFRLGLEETAIDKGENSTLHFIEKTQELLRSQ